MDNRDIELFIIVTFVKKMEMSDKELKKLQKKFKTFKKKTLNSKENALRFLKDAGIYDSNGKLSKAYK